MFLKRTLILAVGVLGFIACYIGYFALCDKQMEDRFRQERQAHGVDDTVLTTQIASSPVSQTAPSPAQTPPDESTESSQASSTASDTSTTPVISISSPTTATTDTSSTPVSPSATSAAPDTNVIIGPIPPSSTPDSTPAPSNSTPSDTNSVSPSAPPASTSTMLYPGIKNLALFMLATSTPLSGGNAQTQAEPATSPTISPSAPAANAPSAPAASPTTPMPAPAAPASNAVTSAASTNEVPVTSGPARPAAVEASVIVLLYHQFVPAGVHIPPKLQWTINQDVFETEMKYIHDNGYHVVPMSDLLKFLRHEIGLPPNSVVITIDDGYKSAIVYAAPILKKYGFPWTFFVYPDFITTAESKGAASWNDLLALQADGVDIECHSMTHPNLSSHHQKIKGVWHNFTPAEYDQWLTTETTGAKTLLEQKLGKPVICFAYPYGNYNKEVEAKTIAAGFQAIFTVADNPVHSSTSMYSIGRYTITQSVIKNFYAYLRQGALGLADIDPAPGATISNPRPIITAVLGYAGTIDPNSIETSVRDFGLVRHDFDPKTSTLRLYLPRDLVQAVNLVNIRAKDAQTGQVMVANWHFNYEPPVAAPIHPPLGAIPPAPAVPAKNSAPTATSTTIPATAPTTNASTVISSSTPVSATTAVPATNQPDPPQTATAVH